MYEILVKSKFDAAHQLREYKGKCANIHGHTWEIEVYLQGLSLNSEGMLIDFSDVKESLNKIIEKYDHHFINEVPPFDTVNPTAENIARELFYAFKNTLPEEIALYKVKVWESQNSCAVYKES